jgi:chemotaxis protein MotB
LPQRARSGERAGGLTMRAKDHPVIVIRRTNKHHGHHGGAWKVAYADFVTAMMAFFLVMWLSAQDSRIRSAIAGYFKEPGVLPHEQSNSIMASGPGGVDDSGLAVLNRKPNEHLEAEQRALVVAAEHIRQRFVASRDFDSLRDQVEFAVTPEGLRIELVDRNGSSFFDNGSSKLLGESERILSVIAAEVGKLPNDVVIEGHTDSRPYTTGERYGNWELSSERANAARRVMTDQGLRAGQIRAVRGFADTELRIPAQPLDPRNRRVSILVRSQSAADTEAAIRNIQAKTATVAK